MGRFRVIVVGKSRCGWANEAVADYTRRLRRFGGVSEVAVKQAKFRGDPEPVRVAESRAIADTLGARDVLVVLDERGRGYGTPELAELLDDARQRGPVVFALGGPYGHADLLRERAWRTIRLSELVLNHEVARVLLYEQLYRCLSLLEGTPYHHA
ncbi:MAG: 23S rRNA (pseudouridine(1915)-N(3))-methyltransferase RlmH [Myxococcales bacterium]|nr:23S rRNA (pseudouridine(1915)-N(3))-methyltransferase RlmH [Myxococcales bacterium]